MKKQIILIAMILAITSVSKITIAETNCPECLAKRVQALEAGQAEILETLKAIQDRLDQTPPAPPVEQVACSKLTAEQRSDLRTVCVTSKGAKFKRVEKKYFGEAWQDEAGMIWSDRIGSGNHYDVIDNCKAIAGRLPSKGDFIRGEVNGIREVLPNMKDRWFWSSSVHPYYSDYACYFFGGSGGGIFNDGRYDGLSVRCVAGR